uniref:Uncharacterized protein n=1 Tax=Schizaphis graminum TaxID=13262 RepID=A0A2S2NCI9_SCHGA
MKTVVGVIMKAKRNTTSKVGHRYAADHNIIIIIIVITCACPGEGGAQLACIGKTQNENFAYTWRIARRSSDEVVFFTTWPSSYNVVGGVSRIATGWKKIRLATHAEMSRTR